MRKLLILALAILSVVCLLTASGCDKTPRHNFESAYTFDESNHWQKCTDEGCEEVANNAEHSYQLTGTINTCTVCGYSYNTANTYEISLQTLGGTVLKGITINLFDKNNQQIATGKTNANGKVRFSEITPDDYVAKLDESTLPKGFYVSEEIESIVLSKTVMKTTVKVPSKLIEEDMPSGHKYSVGDIAYDIRTTSVNAQGKQKDISLSAYLAKYKAVVLNFWFAGCNPCKVEFPYINEVYLEYQNEIAVIAINQGVDTAEDIADFVASNGYAFDFVNDESMFVACNNAFKVSAYPTTVVIDRYGAVAHIETGSMPTRSVWVNMFEHYIADDYQPDYVYGYDDGGNTDGGDTLAKPNVEMPSTEEIAQAITKVNTFTKADTFLYSAEQDEFSWPWVVSEKEGQTCLKTSNANKVNSYSILLIDVQLKAGQQVVFDYFVSTELDGDLLYVQVDTVLQHTLSGENKTWNNDQLLYVARRDGSYQISLTYLKGTTVNAGEDTVYIKNLRIEEDFEVENHVDLLYNATDNYTLDADVAIPEEYKGFVNHVAYYFDESDGFYHVALSGDTTRKSEEDPILFADLYYSTPWNSNSVWLLAYTGQGLFNQADPTYKEGYYQAIEDYAWIQQNNVTGYAPLTMELKNILEDIVENLGRTDNSQDHFDGVDQWLEICRYYVHYGQREQKDGKVVDTCYAWDNNVEALKWRVAKDYGTMTEDVLNIHVNVYSVHLPRGNYYRFTTTKSGAYLIRSWEPNGSDYDLTAQDPLGFICDDKGNILAENDNYKIEVQGYGKDENGVVQDGVNSYALYDNNFYMYVYLEAGKTYHVAGCFNDPYATGEYDVTVEYLGENHRYFTSCATDPAYTYDENDPTFRPFILPQMGKDRFFVGDDGNYYAQEPDGSQGSLIYIRLVGPTYLSSYNSTTLEALIEQGAIGSTEDDKLYLKHLLIESKKQTDPELYGYVVATERLVSIINKYANGSDTEDSNLYASTSWLLTAYYFRNVNELTLQQAQAKFN